MKTLNNLKLLQYHLSSAAASVTVAQVRALEALKLPLNASRAVIKAAIDTKPLSTQLILIDIFNLGDTK